MRGRKPLPSTVKRLAGTLRSDRIPPTDPLASTPSLADEPLPSELSGNRGAIQEWRRIVREATWLRQVDRSSVVAAALEWSGYLAALAHVRRTGPTTKRGTGGVAVSPFLIIARQRLQCCLRLWPELGLTPTSRMRIAIADLPAPGDSFDEFDHNPRPN